MDWILSFTNLKAFSFSWLLLKWNYLMWCHPKWCDPWSFTAFLFPSLFPSPLCISKATLFGLSDIPYTSEFSLLLPKELFFICQNPIQVMIFFYEAFLSSSSLPDSLLPSLLACSVSWTHFDNFYQICCNFLFVHLCIFRIQCVYLCHSIQ